MPHAACSGQVLTQHEILHDDFRVFVVMLASRSQQKLSLSVLQGRCQDRNVCSSDDATCDAWIPKEHPPQRCKDTKCTAAECCDKRVRSGSADCNYMAAVVTVDTLTVKHAMCSWCRPPATLPSALLQPISPRPQYSCSPHFVRASALHLNAQSTTAALVDRPVVTTCVVQASQIRKTNQIYCAQNQNQMTPLAVMP